MCADHVIDAVVREYAHFTLDDIENEAEALYEHHCEYAQIFDEWARELLQNHVASSPTRERIEQAKVLLTDRYFEFRVTVPKLHRDRLGTNRHVCVMSVFVEHYERLRVLSLRAAPSIYSPAPTTIREVSGIYLGEIVEDGE